MANPASTITDLATIVQHITSVQPGNYGPLAHTLKSFSADEQRDSLLGGLLPGTQDPLTLLNPRINTLGYLYILTTRVTGGNGAAPISPDIVEGFCRDFDPEQARLAPQRVTKLAKEIVRWATTNNQPKFAVKPLHDLLTQLPLEPGWLTPLHAIFVQICLKAQHIPPAILRPILLTPITHVSTTSFPDLDYNDNLLYHYIGGIIFGLWKDWKNAEEFFEICATSPAQMPSALQWDALKKLVLVQCISRGKTRSLPKYVHGGLNRLLKNSPYGAFQRAYPRSTSTLRDLVQKESETFANDRNRGLINLAMEAAPRWNIKRLTDTYLSLSLGEIGREVGITSEAEVRSVVVSMIERAEIFATLGDDGSVAFGDAPIVVSKALVDAALRQAQTQSDMLLRLERDVGASKEFLMKILKSRDDDRFRGPAGDPDDMMQMFGASAGANWAEEAVF